MITKKEIFTEKYTRLLRFDEFAELLADTLNQGYGNINFKIDVRQGKVAVVFISRTTSYKGEEFNREGRVEGYEDIK